MDGKNPYRLTILRDWSPTPEVGATRMLEETIVNRRYRVDRLIGEGGMAIVFRGHDVLLGRDVAIKALRPQFAASPNFRARFEREAQAAASFSHPNIIDIYDVGEEDDTPYIVMEFVSGQTLKSIITAEGPFHPDDVAALLEQICGALDYAHERGYVHRDVKPQNILVDRTGTARVVDFGIAKSLADVDLTEIGSGLGTIHYLSPEQASGLMATPASDVYSVGVVAFEMLTKELPFDADSAVGVAMRHVHDTPPAPSATGIHVPAAVDAIVLRALAKDPTKRFSRAGAMAAAMTKWREYDAASATLFAAPASRMLSERPPAREVSAPPVSARRPERAPVRSARTTVAPPVEPASRGQSAPANAAQPAVAAEAIGCTTWLVGIAILLGLIGLIWLGVQLSPRLASLGDDGENAPAISAPSDTPSLPDEADADLTSEIPDQPADRTSIAPTGAPTIQPAAPLAIAVPDLIGMTAEEAISTLNSRGLVLIEGEGATSDTVPTGAIARQEPAAASNLAQGESVTVQVSRGSDRIDLAALNLAGQNPDQAEAALRAQGLEVERVEVGSEEVDSGLIVGTDPAQEAVPGDTVTLQVSVGDRVRIPGEIQGQPLNQVVRQLERLGLQVGNQFPVDRETIEEFGLDLASGAIEDGDVVGVQADGVGLGEFVSPGATVDLVYYDRARDR